MYARCYFTSRQPRPRGFFTFTAEKFFLLPHQLPSHDVIDVSVRDVWKNKQISCCLSVFCTIESSYLTILISTKFLITVNLTKWWSCCKNRNWLRKKMTHSTVKEIQFAVNLFTTFIGQSCFLLNIFLVQEIPISTCGCATVRSDSQRQLSPSNQMWQHLVNWKNVGDDHIFLLCLTNSKLQSRVWCS